MTSVGTLLKIRMTPDLTHELSDRVTSNSSGDIEYKQDIEKTGLIYFLAWARVCSHWYRMY